MSNKKPYPLSRDYTRLRELLDKGYSIVCYADYRWSDGEVLRDICEARKMPDSEDDSYSFNARGIGYLDWHQRHQTKYELSFDRACEKSNIEFIDIDSHE